MPLIRRLPKRGFNNAAFHKNYAIVNLDSLNNFKAGTTVNEQLLRESKLIRGNFAGIKILGDGELKHGLTIEADKFSESARAKIEKAGGNITVREARQIPSDGAPKESETAPTAEAKPKKRVTKKPAQKKPAAEKKAPAKKKKSAKKR